MKKIIAVVLTLCLALSAVTALAETRTFFMSGVQDSEGNVISYEGNPDFPVLVLVIDDEAMACAFGTEEEMIAGTFEIAGQTDEALTLAVTLESGEQFNIVYVIAEDACAYVDAEGYVYVLQNVETLNQAA